MSTHGGQRHAAMAEAMSPPKPAKLDPQTDMSEENKGREGWNSGIVLLLRREMMGLPGTDVSVTVYNHRHH